MFKGLLSGKPAGAYVTTAELESRVATTSANLREEIDLQRREIETLAQEIAQLREQVAQREAVRASQVTEAPVKKPAARRTRKKVIQDASE